MGSSLCDDWELNTGSEFKKLIFQKLLKILINHVRFFDYIIISKVRKCWHRLQIYVFASICSCDLMSLRPYAVDRSCRSKKTVFFDSLKMGHGHDFFYFGERRKICGFVRSNFVGKLPTAVKIRRLCPWSLASSISVLGLMASKAYVLAKLVLGRGLGFFFESLALAWNVGSSTPPLEKIL